MPDFIDLLLDTVILVDAEGRIVHANAACERMFGYSPQELVGRKLLDFVVPEDRERTLEEAARVIAGHDRIGFENRYIRKDGRRVHVMWSARWSEKDQLRIGVARDVTELRQAEAVQHATYAISEAAHEAEDLDVLLREIHRILATLVPVAGLALATCDRRTKKLCFTYQRDSEGNSPVLDVPPACHFCDQTLCGGLPGARPSAYDSACSLALPLVVQQEKIGVLVLKSEPGTHYSERDKELLHFVSEQVAIAIDRAQLKAELLRAARHDELTGLPNRRLFQDRIQSALARCIRNQRAMAVLYVDIDDFKQVNDSLGHAVGDLMLQEFARRLQFCVRETDTVARLGGDEFVLLLEDLQSISDAQAVADKIREVMSVPMEMGSRVLRVGASIGMALYPEHGLEIEQLLGHADKAMYSDKRSKASSPI